ncbi:FtsW/RodA/SpoVE family cell cycle protein [Cellulomonas sp. PhB143]|uniref:FtsW/RodA/SpoVE family cell cycle protein n=1 Tax=Cellulomonas sp. PhB143 TaxID=2485186 RepID=UPI000FC03FEE|nr:FtsW/RodA/SpoVE family cell cycle protein [Cellulomonas sp. PhB143]ROS75575.1 cell elongation-specific peptidoglycan biosynthesis regulator RodA [Cellulomonas sp. PhB143]
MSTVEPVVRRPMRGKELVLLVLALALGIGAFANVALRTLGELPEDFYVYSAVWAGLALVAHVVLRIRAPFADQVLLPVAVALNGIGLAAIYRYDVARHLQDRSSDLARGQLTMSALAIVLACVLVFVLRDHRALRRTTYTAMILGLLLILLPLVPHIGTSINGAQIWIRVAGFSFQPAEVAKIVLAVFFAGYLVTNRDTLALAGRKVLGLQLPRLRDLGPILLVWAASLGVLVFENDLGTSILFFGLFVAMLYVATERFSWVVLGVGLLAAAAVFAATTVPHVQQRVEAWLHPFDDAVYNQTPGGSGQLVQGLFAMANGGLFGTGWGNDYPLLTPYSYSDFIYTMLGEQLGLTGLLGILALYILFVERGLRTALGVRDGFGKLLACGLAFTVALQLFVVVGGITRIIPLTGLTLPFVAQGGSSVLANWLIVALLLRVSDNARRPSALPVRGTVGKGGIVASVGAPQVLEAVDSAGEPDVAPAAAPIRVGAGEPRPARAVGSAGADDAGTQLTEVVRPGGGPLPSGGPPVPPPPAPPERPDRHPVDEPGEPQQRDQPDQPERADDDEEGRA